MVGEDVTGQLAALRERVVSRSPLAGGCAPVASPTGCINKNGQCIFRLTGANKSLEPLFCRKTLLVGPHSPSYHDAFVAGAGETFSSQSERLAGKIAVLKLVPAPAKHTQP